MHAKSLAAAVISLLPAIAVADIQSFVQQLSSGVLHLWQLSEPLQEVIPSQYDFTPLPAASKAGSDQLAPAPPLWSPMAVSSYLSFVG
jgi:hypothetical protein